MPEYGGQRYPAVCPYVYYEDGPKALEFLADAFGFRERVRDMRPDGSMGHAEVDVGDAVIMLGCPPGHKSPSRVGSIGGGVYVHVDDVDGHYQRAKAAGAQVQGEPTDMPYGVRTYGALDLEGNQWWFSEPIASG